MIAQVRETAQPTAAPCRRCGTEGGHIKGDCNRPTRTRGLCLKCYNYFFNTGFAGSRGVPAIEKWLATLDTQAEPTPIRPEVAPPAEEQPTEISRAIVERQMDRHRVYRQVCAEAHRAAVPDATITEFEPLLARQDRIDLLVGRLVRLEAEADELGLRIDGAREELARLRGGAA